jgi:hypothetical protein
LLLERGARKGASREEERGARRGQERKGEDRSASLLASLPLEERS